MPNYRDYHVSINNEFVNLRDRVRNLVKNWSEDGRHKEAIFKNIINRYLPDNFSIGTGFIVTQDTTENIHQTRQIDVIIYDNHFPVLFKEGDFIITTPDGVFGIVEIKTKLVRSKLSEIIDTCNENAKLISENGISNFFNGLFFFEEGDPVDERVELIITEAKNKHPISQRGDYILNHIAFGENNFIKYFKKNGIDVYSNYNLVNLAYSFFIMNIISELVWLGETPHNRLWFVEDKELHKIKDF